MGTSVDVVLDEYEQIPGFCGFENGNGTIVIAEGIHAKALARNFEPFAVYRKVGSANADASDLELSAPPSSPPSSSWTNNGNTWPEDCPACGAPWHIKSRTMGRAHGQPHQGTCENGHQWHEL